MKKAFTLIELIMVIVILGIIALITLPTVNSILKDSRQKAYNNQIDLIEDTARTYMTKNNMKLPKTKCNVSVAQMKQAGLLSNEDVLNPMDTTTNFNSAAVTVEWKNNKYQYTFVATAAGIASCI